MLWETYPKELDQLTLHEAYLTLQGDPVSKIPLLVWLFENPNSRLALPGKINLYGHDCLHLLLKQGFSSAGEAYVLGFTMGNDPKTHRLHISLFQWIAYFLYPRPYRFSLSDLHYFRAGIKQGQQAQIKALNQTDFQSWKTLTLKQIRYSLGL